MARINKDTPGYLPSGSRPRCRWCHAILRAKTKEVGHMERRELNPRPGDTYGVKGFTHQYVLDSLAVEGWGYMGENLFCSLTCGYHFACRAVKNFNQQG